MKKLAFLLLVSVTVFACTPDPTNPTASGSMSISLDSAATQTVTSFNGTLLREVQFGEAGRRIDLNVNINGGTFILSVANWDWQLPPEDGVLEKTYDTEDLGNDSTLVGPNTQCKDGVDVTFCDSGMGTYIINGQQFTSAFIESGPGTIVITDNDVDDLTISGTFDFRAVEGFSDNEMTFKGSFVDVPYVVLN